MALSRSVALGFLVLGLVALSQAATLRESSLNPLAADDGPIELGVENGNREQSPDQSDETPHNRNKRDKWETSWSWGTSSSVNASASFGLGKPFSASVKSAGETNQSHETSWNDHTGSGSRGEASSDGWFSSDEWGF